MGIKDYFTAVPIKLKALIKVFWGVFNEIPENRISHIPHNQIDFLA
jgi:hypothetical protein